MNRKKFCTHVVASAFGVPEGVARKPFFGAKTAGSQFSCCKYKTRSLPYLQQDTVNAILYAKGELKMDYDSTEEEPVDYTAFEEKLFEEVRNGKDYQHFLNLSSQLDCMLIRSFLASMQIPTYVEGGNLNKIYGGTSTVVTTVFKMKLYILVEDYDEALEVVKDYIKNKVKSLSEKSGSDKYLKVLELMAAPYNISASQEMLGITIFTKKTKDENPEGILQILKKFFTKNFAMCLLAICCMCFFSAESNFLV